MQWKVWNANPPDHQTLTFHLNSILESTKVFQSFAVHFVTSNMHLSYFNLFHSCCMRLETHTDAFFICLWWQSSDFSI